MNFKHKLIQFACLAVCLVSTNSRSIVPLYTQTLSAPVFYSHLVPIHFNITVPTVYDTQSLIALYPALQNHCDRFDEPDSEKFDCPLTFYLQQIRDSIRDVLTTKKSFQKGPSSLHSRNHHLCANFDPIFPSLQINPEAFQQVMDEIRKCLGADKPAVEIPDFSYSFRSVYSESSLAFLRAFNGGTSNKSAEYALSVEIHNILGFVQYLAEKTRWEQSINQCRIARTLPTLLINETVLKNELNVIQNTLETQDYQLAIPTEAASFPAYWTLPTVDCTFTSGTEEETKGSLYLNVILQVPVVRKDEKWSLHSAIAVPFHGEYSGTDYVCLAQEPLNEAIYYFESVTKRIVKADPKFNRRENFLQHVGSQTTSGFLDSGTQTCLSKILAGASNIQIIEACPLVCLEFGKGVISSDTDEIAVERVDNNLYYVAKATTELKTIRFDCGVNETVQIPPNGALEIKLGCECKLIVGNLSVIAERPCNGTSVAHDTVTPIHSGKNIMFQH